MNSHSESNAPHYCQVKVAYVQFARVQHEGNSCMVGRSIVATQPVFWAAFVLCNHTRSPYSVLLQLQ